MNIFVNPGNQHADKYLFVGEIGCIFDICKNAMGSVGRNIVAAHKTHIAPQGKGTPHNSQNVLSLRLKPP